MVEILFLKSAPHNADQLGRAIYSEWKEMYDSQGKSEDAVVATVQSRAVDDRIPCTLIAVDDGFLCGSITLKVDEENGIPGLSPWMAGVFVLPQFRGKGIGWSLIDFVEHVARDTFGIKKLYLYTSTAEKLYLRKGYSVFSERVKDDKLLKYMEKEL